MGDGERQSQTLDTYDIYILWGQFSPQNKISYLWHIPLSSGGRPAGVDVLTIIVIP